MNHTYVKLLYMSIISSQRMGRVRVTALVYTSALQALSFV